MAAVLKPSLWKDHPQKYLINVHVPWRSIKILLPHRVRRKLRSKLRSRVSPASSSITSLKTSFSPLDTLKSLQAHRWSVYDGQYLVIIAMGIFSLCVIGQPPLLKTLVSLAILTSLLLPITAQVMLPALPMLTYLIFFYACAFVPGDWRPPIWVRVLPALENIFYGANLSNILSAHKNTFLDLMAWLPYGITHFGAPAVVTLILFIFGPPGLAPSFGKSIGYLGIVGVIIQFVFPCSPPWYENMYGLAPAHYGMEGSPGGLRRIDELFGIDLYTSSFTASPVPFGAFPSLHAGFSTIEALFMSHAFPRLKPLFIMYTLWLWWATMYLSHHYAVDLIGGGLLAALTFYYAKTRFVPLVQADKNLRWDYDYVEYGSPSEGYAYGLASFGDDFHADSDELTVGSSSSISSGCLSPVDEYHTTWDSDTVWGSSDLESGR